MSRLELAAAALLDEPTAAHDPCSHLANAQRLVEHYGDQLLYVEGIGWHVYGPPWRHDELAVQRLAQGLGRIIANEAAGMAPWVAEAPDKATREQRQKDMDRRFRWAGQSESLPTIEYSLAMARPLLAVQAADMDAGHDLLGLPSGVLDLQTMRHRRYHTKDRITKVAGCDFDLSATSPTWERIIDEAMGADPELVDYLQRLAGYMLSGRRGEHILPVAWGTGANSKSTILGALQAVMGEYASSAAPGLLIQRHSNEHPTALADLQGRRLIVVSETGETGRLNEEQVKLLTGGDRITARRMRQDFFTFEPTHLLALQTNHRPRVSGTDEGIWRRLRLIPFAVTVPPELRDPALPEKLRAELPGILNWCLEGWRRYREQG
ncbi:MAG: phage/plasmid primase, P4 family, partial [Lysobacterales bacterium]